MDADQRTSTRERAHTSLDADLRRARDVIASLQNQDWTKVPELKSLVDVKSPTRNGNQSRLQSGGQCGPSSRVSVQGLRINNPLGPLANPKSRATASSARIRGLSEEAAGLRDTFSQARQMSSSTPASGPRKRCTTQSARHSSESRRWHRQLEDLQEAATDGASHLLGGSTASGLWHQELEHSSPVATVAAQSAFGPGPPPHVAHQAKHHFYRTPHRKARWVSARTRDFKKPYLEEKQQRPSSTEGILPTKKAESQPYWDVDAGATGSVGGTIVLPSHTIPKPRDDDSSPHSAAPPKALSDMNSAIPLIGDPPLGPQLIQQVLVRGGTAAPFRAGKDVPLEEFDTDLPHPTPLPQPAVSRFFGTDGSWWWRPCTVLDYKKDTKRYVIHWDDPETVDPSKAFEVAELEAGLTPESTPEESAQRRLEKRDPAMMREVLRLNLRFLAEDPYLHSQEVAFQLWQREQASRDEKFDAALLEAAEQAAGEVLGADFLPLWAWRAVPGTMARIGSTVDVQKLSERSVDVLLTEQVQIHAWMEVVKNVVARETPPVYSHHNTTHLLPGGAFSEMYACGVLPKHNLLSRMGNTHTWIHSHPLLQDPMYRFRQVAVELKHMQLLRHLEQEHDLARAVRMELEMVFRGVVYYKDELSHLEGLMDAALSDRLTSTELGRDQVRRFLRLTWLLVDDALITSILDSMRLYLTSFPQLAADGAAEPQAGSHCSTMTLRVSLVWDSDAGQLAYAPPLEDFMQLGDGMLEEMKEVLTELQVLKYDEAQNKIVKGDPPARGMLLASTSDCFQQASATIGKVLSQSTHKLRSAVNELSEKHNLHPDSDGFSSAGKFELGQDLEEYMAGVEDCNKGLLEALLGMRDTIYGIFILDVSQMVTMAEGASARTREHAYKDLINHWSAQVEQLHSKLDTNFGLKWDSQQDRSAEEYAELKTYIANFDQDNAHLMEASMRTDQLMLALQKARVELPDELLDKHFTALVELKELRTLVTETAPQLEAMSEVVKEKLVQRQEQLKENLQETLQRVDLAKYEEVSEAEVEQAEEHAAVLMHVLSAMKRDVVEMEDTIRQQEILGVEGNTELRDHLVEAIATIEPLTRVWVLLSEWNDAVGQWSITAFRELNAAQMRTQVYAFLATATELTKLASNSREGFGGQDTPVPDAVAGLSPEGPVKMLQNMMVHLEILKDLMPVITKLRHPGMRDRHWHAFFDLFVHLGDPADWKPATDLGITGHQFAKASMLDPNFSVPSLLLLPLGLVREEAVSIVYQAMHEYELESALVKMSKDLRAVYFEVAPHASLASLRALHGAEAMAELVDDQLLTMQKLLSRPYAATLETHARDWQSTLQNALETLERLIRLQARFMFLWPVMHNRNVTDNIPGTKRAFASVEEHWDWILDVVLMNVPALMVCEQGQVKERIITCHTQLEIVISQLIEYLYQKRYNFSRFFFISNEELIDVLGTASQLARLQATLCKCFSPAVTELTPEGTMVVGIKSVHRESLQLSGPVSMKGVPVEEWLTLVLANMIRAFQLQLGECLQTHFQHWWRGFKGQLPWYPDVEEFMHLAPAQQSVIFMTQSMLGEMGHTSQVLLLTHQALFTAQVEEHLPQGFKAMQHLAEETSDHAAGLGALLHARVTMLPTLHKHTVGTLLLHCTYQRDVVARLVDLKVLEQDNIEWMRCIRYYPCEPDAVSAKNRMLAFNTGNFAGKHAASVGKNYEMRLMDNVVPYGCEYIGAVTRLVMSPLTERCYCAMVYAVRHSLSAALIGPASSGKTEMCKDLATSAGKLSVVLDCSAILELDCLGNFFKGVVSSGAWGVLDDISRMQPEMVQMLSKYAISALQARATGSKEVLLDRLSFRLDVGFGVLATLTTGPTTRRVLGDEVKLFLRAITLPGPDVEFVCRVLFQAEGFQNAELLARKLVACFTLSAQVLSKSNHLCVGLQTMKLCIRLMGQRMFPPDHTRADAQSEDKAQLVVRAQSSKDPVPMSVRSQAPRGMRWKRAAARASEVPTIRQSQNNNERADATDLPGSEALPPAARRLRDLMSKVLTKQGFKVPAMIKRFHSRKDVRDQEEAKQEVEAALAAAAHAKKHKQRRRAHRGSEVVNNIARNAEAQERELHALHHVLQAYMKPLVQGQEAELFEGVLRDVFLRPVPPSLDTGNTLQRHVRAALKESGLSDEHPRLIDKCLQLGAAMEAHRGCLLVGPPGGGKTTCYNTLANAVEAMAKQARLDSSHATNIAIKALAGLNPQSRDVVEKALLEKARRTIAAYPAIVRVLMLDRPKRYINLHVVHPQCLGSQLMYGVHNEATALWKDGVVSVIFRKCQADRHEQPCWVVLDGEVEYDWAESLNSCLDGTRQLCLNNGERVMLPKIGQLSLLFEATSLGKASPAIVGRCGMIFLDSSHHGWEALVNSKLCHLPRELVEYKSLLSKLYMQIFKAALEFVHEEGTEVAHIDVTVAQNHLHIMNGFLQLFETPSQQKRDGVQADDTDRRPMKIVEESSQEVREHMQRLSIAGEGQVNAQELLKDLGLSNMISELKPDTPLHQHASSGAAHEEAGEEEEVESQGGESDEEAYRQAAAAATLCFTKPMLEHTRAEALDSLHRFNSAFYESSTVRGTKSHRTPRRHRKHAHKQKTHQDVGSPRRHGSKTRKDQTLQHFQPRTNRGPSQQRMSMEHLLELEERAAALEAQQQRMFLHQVFLFALAWSVGGNMNPTVQQRFDVWVMELCNNSESCPGLKEALPTPFTSLYDVCLDAEARQWMRWDDFMPPQVQIVDDISDMIAVSTTSHRDLNSSGMSTSNSVQTRDARIHLSHIWVPTMDTLAATKIIQLMAIMACPVVLVGPAASGKTMMMREVLACSGAEALMMPLEMTLSTHSNAVKLKSRISDHLERRWKQVLGPPNKMKMLLFIDDLSVPASVTDTVAGDLLRAHLEFGGWHDPEQAAFQQVEDVHLLAASRIPAVPTPNMAPRLLRHVLTLYRPEYEADTLSAISQTMLALRFSSPSHAQMQLWSPLERVDQASLDMYQCVCRQLLPTPANPHYQFDIRNYFQILQGVLYADGETVFNPESLSKLLVHESLRVLGDRLSTIKDRDWILETLIRVARRHFDFHMHANEVAAMHFGKYGKGDLSDYTRITDWESWVQNMNELGMTFVKTGNKDCPLGLVLFSEACSHLVRVLRVLRACQGHMLLIGDTGTGRSTVTKLAAYVAGMELYEAHGPSLESASEELAKLRTQSHDLFWHMMKAAAFDDRHIVFLLRMENLALTHSKSLLEDINWLLMAGEIPELLSMRLRQEVHTRMKGMFTLKFHEHTAKLANEKRRHHHNHASHNHDTKQSTEETPSADDSVPIRDQMEAVGLNISRQASFRSNDPLYNGFVTLLQSKLHVVVLADNNDKDALRECLRAYPALTNCCTVDWFDQWSIPGLTAVAQAKMTNVAGIAPEEAEKVVSLCAHMHSVTRKHILKMRMGMLPWGVAANPRTSHERPRSAFYALDPAQTEKDEPFELSNPPSSKISRALSSSATAFYSFMEFITTFKVLVGTKLRRLSDKVARYETALRNLDSLSKEAETLKEEKQNAIDDLQKSVDELATVTAALDHETEVLKESEAEMAQQQQIISQEAEVAQRIADNAKDALNSAMPELMEAEALLGALNKQDIAELKSHRVPPESMSLVVEAVCIILGRKPLRVEASKVTRSIAKIHKVIRFAKSIEENAEHENGEDYMPSATHLRSYDHHGNLDKVAKVGRSVKAVSKVTSRTKQKLMQRRKKRSAFDKAARAIQAVRVVKVAQVQQPAQLAQKAPEAPPDPVVTNTEPGSEASETNAVASAARMMLLMKDAGMYKEYVDDGVSETESLGLSSSDSEEEQEEDGDWASAEESESEAVNEQDKEQETIDPAHPSGQPVTEEHAEESTSAANGLADDGQDHLAVDGKQPRISAHGEVKAESSSDKRNSRDAVRSRSKALVKHRIRHRKKGQRLHARQPAQVSPEPTPVPEQPSSRASSEAELLDGAFSETDKDAVTDTFFRFRTKRNVPDEEDPAPAVAGVEQEVTPDVLRQQSQHDLTEIFAHNSRRWLSQMRSQKSFLQLDDSAIDYRGARGAKPGLDAELVAEPNEVEDLKVQNRHRKTTRATALDVHTKSPVAKAMRAKRNKDVDEVATQDTPTSPVVGISRTIQKVLQAKQDSSVHADHSLPNHPAGAEQDKPVETASSMLTPQATHGNVDQLGAHSENLELGHRRTSQLNAGDETDNLETDVDEMDKTLAHSDLKRVPTRQPRAQGVSPNDNLLHSPGSTLPMKPARATQYHGRIQYVDDYWSVAKELFADPRFLQTLQGFKHTHISDEALAKLKSYIQNPKFTAESVGRVSIACKSLCIWVHAMYRFHKTSINTIEPLKADLDEANFLLEGKRQALREHEELLMGQHKGVEHLTQRLEVLWEQVDMQEAMVQEKQEKAAVAARASQVLESQRTHWGLRIPKLQTRQESLVGDVLLASWHIAYSGWLSPVCRGDALHFWKHHLSQLNVKMSEDFDIQGFWEYLVHVQYHTELGLQPSAHAAENAIILENRLRWPLAFDPHLKAAQWLRNVSDAKQLTRVQLSLSLPPLPVARKYSQQVEWKIDIPVQILAEKIQRAMEEGQLLILKVEAGGNESVLKQMLQPILLHPFMKHSTGKYAPSHVLDMHPDFRLIFLVHDESHHDIIADIGPVLNIVDFSLTAADITTQLLKKIIASKSRAVEDDSLLRANTVILNNSVRALQEQILRLTMTHSGNLLTDDEVLEVARHCTLKEEELREHMEEVTESMQQTHNEAIAFQQTAVQIVMVFFCISQLAAVYPVYRCSVDDFQDLFQTCLEGAEDREFGEARLRVTEELRVEFAHRLRHRLVGMLLERSSRSLLARHRTLLGFLYAAHCARAEGLVDDVEWAAFAGMARENPADPFALGLLEEGEAAGLAESQGWEDRCPYWMAPLSWRQLHFMCSQVPGWSDLMDEHVDEGVILSSLDWREWAEGGDPFQDELPEPWNFVMMPGTFQRLMLMQCFCPRRMPETIQRFVQNAIGRRYTENTTSFDIAQAAAQAKPTTPLLCIHTQGMSPAEEIMAYAKRANMGKLIEFSSLGRDQNFTRVSQAIQDAAEKGQWVIVLNCHSIAPEPLLQLVTLLRDLHSYSSHVFVSPRFRLWFTIEMQLGTSPLPKVLIDSCVRFTLEPPTDMQSVFNRAIDETKMDRTMYRAFPPMLLHLYMMHGLLIGRLKFQPRSSWLQPYDFDRSDFTYACNRVLMLMATEKEMSVLDESDTAAGKQNSPGARHSDSVKLRQSVVKQIMYELLEVIYGTRLLDQHSQQLLQAFIYESFCLDKSVAGYRDAHAKGHNPHIQQAIEMYIPLTPNLPTGTLMDKTVPWGPESISQMYFVNHMKSLRPSSTPDALEMYGLHTNTRFVFCMNEMHTFLQELSNINPWLEPEFDDEDSYSMLDNDSPFKQLSPTKLDDPSSAKPVKPKSLFDSTLGFSATPSGVGTPAPNERVFGKASAPAASHSGSCIRVSSFRSRASPSPVFSTNLSRAENQAAPQPVQSPSSTATPQIRAPQSPGEGSASGEDSEVLPGVAVQSRVSRRRSDQHPQHPQKLEPRDEPGPAVKEGHRVSVREMRKMRESAHLDPFSLQQDKSVAQILAMIVEVRSALPQPISLNSLENLHSDMVRGFQASLQQETEDTNLHPPLEAEPSNASTQGSLTTEQRGFGAPAKAVSRRFSDISDARTTGHAEMASAAPGVGTGNHEQKAMASTTMDESGTNKGRTTTLWKRAHRSTWQSGHANKPLGASQLPSPLCLVLHHECQFYNRLIGLVQSSLSTLRGALFGLHHMTQKMEKLAASLTKREVPQAWLIHGTVPYRSLARWLQQVKQAVQFFQGWYAMNDEQYMRVPAAMHLPSFSDPHKLIAGVVQWYARKNRTAMDTISTFMQVVAEEAWAGEAPMNGCYLSGLWMENACMDRKSMALAESRPNEIWSKMCTVWLTTPPKLSSDYAQKLLPVAINTPLGSSFSCPIYRTSARSTDVYTQTSNFVVSIDLHPGERTVQHWISRGVILVGSVLDW